MLVIVNFVLGAEALQRVHAGKGELALGACGINSERRKRLLLRTRPEARCYDSGVPPYSMAVVSCSSSIII